MRGTNDLFSRGKAFYSEGNLLDAAECFETGFIAEAASAQSFSDLLLTLNYSPGCDAEALSGLHRKFDTRYCQALTQSAAAHPNTPEPERKIRIGYVSPDLRAHAVAFFIAPVLMQHDRNRFEVFAYYNYPEKDQFTNNLRQCCHQWRDIAGLPDEEVASLIREDGIDILDLAGHEEWRGYRRVTEQLFQGQPQNHHDLGPSVERNSRFQVDSDFQWRQQGVGGRCGQTGPLQQRNTLFATTSNGQSAVCKKSL